MSRRRTSRSGCGRLFGCCRNRKSDAQSQTESSREIPNNLEGIDSKIQENKTELRRLEESREEKIEYLELASKIYDGFRIDEIEKMIEEDVPVSEDPDSMSKWGSAWDYLGNLLHSRLRKRNELRLANDKIRKVKDYIERLESEKSRLGGDLSLELPRSRNPKLLYSRQE